MTGSFSYFPLHGAAYTRTGDLKNTVLGLSCSKIRLDNGGFLLTGGGQLTCRTGQRKRSKLCANLQRKNLAPRARFETSNPSVNSLGIQNHKSLSSRRLGFLGTSIFSLKCSKVVPPRELRWSMPYPHHQMISDDHHMNFPTVA